MLEAEQERWLTLQANLGLAPNTLVAYRRAVEEYATFCARRHLEVRTATREHVALYVRDLTVRPVAATVRSGSADRPPGLANATILQRLTAIRLYYDFLVEEGFRPDNPVGRGRYTSGKGFAGERGRGLVPRYRTLPWIPNDEEWRAVLEAAKTEPLRNRLMLAMAYDAGLRREELCLLATGDIDPAQRLLHIRAETTKGRRAHIVPYSPSTGSLLAAYLVHRRALTRERGSLFVSESRRNRGRPITLWTWSKVVRRLGHHTGLPRLSTHTLRHLCLTDLARAGWELHEIAAFAGHRNIGTTLLYIHLSGRELAAKLARAASLHSERLAQIGEALT